MNEALNVHRLQFAFTITFHYIFPQLTMGLALLLVYLKTKALRTNDEHYNRAERKAFLASCLYLVGVLTSVVFGLYPMVLPGRNPVYSLTVEGAKAGAYGLKVGLVWWAIGMILAAGYFTYVYRSFAGKVEVGSDSNGHGY